MVFGWKKSRKKDPDHQKKSAEIDRLITGFFAKNISYEAAYHQLGEILGVAIAQLDHDGEQEFRHTFHLLLDDREWNKGDFDSILQPYLNPVEPIDDWQQIDDDRALRMILEILDNPLKDDLVVRNVNALSRRYGKSDGDIDQFMRDHPDLSAKEYLAELKRDTRFYL